MPSPPGRRQRSNTRNKTTVTTSPGSGHVRLIAGRWRGRRLPVCAVEGLRPTGDRMRETLFNWLQAEIAGAWCLDLFAGTGALGFEALSRYAAGTVFVELDRNVCSVLSQSSESLGLVPVVVTEPSALQGPGNSNREQLDDHAVTIIYAGSASDFLAANTRRFDLVFIDPPFGQSVQWEVLYQLVPQHLAEDALIYVETPVSQAAAGSLPEGCQMYREKRMGDVSAMLLRFRKAQ